MFRWLIGSSLKYRFLLLAASVALVVFGTEQLKNMPVDAFPEFSPPRVEIQTVGPGMSASEVEELITIPMERTLSGTPDLVKIISKSVTQLSVIQLTFKRSADLFEKRQRVQELMNVAFSELAYNTGVPIMLSPSGATKRVMKIGISSDKHSLLDLSMIAYWTMKFRMMTVPGVANIPIWGERVKLLQLRVDPARMRAHSVTLNEVMNTAATALDFSLLRYTRGSKVRKDGMIDTPTQRLVIHHDRPVYAPEHLEQIPIALVKGRLSAPPRLRDVSNVKWGTWQLFGDAVINDGPGLMMIVEKLPWANTLEVTRGIEKVIEELRPGLPDIEIDATLFRPATFIEDSIDNLTKALIFGAILVIIVLAAFLYEWRVALISVIAIPLSLVAAGVVLWMMGSGINIMVLAGFIVALGSVVDDAIIDVENIVRRLREHRRAGGAKSTARIIVEASLEVRPAILQATVIIVLAVSPVFFMGGLASAFFAPLATSFNLAMLASMVVAVTVTPALCYIMLDRATIEHRESPMVPWLKRHYRALLSGTIARPRATAGCVLVVVFAGIAVWPTLGHILLPSFKERDFLIHWVPPEGTSRQETFRIVRRSGVELRKIPGVRNFSSHLGQAFLADEPKEINFAENWVAVDREADYDETRAALAESVAGYPGMRRDLMTYLRERIKEVLTGASESIVIQIHGPEIGVMRESAAKVFDAIRDIPGLIDVNVGQQLDVPGVEIKVDLDKAAVHGIKPGDIKRIVAVVTSGIEMTDIYHAGRVFEIGVWAPESQKGSIDSLRDFLIDTPYAGRVRLGDIADVRLVPIPNTINRLNNSRYLAVRANVEGRGLASAADEIAERLKSVAFPVGVHPEILGESKALEEARSNLLYTTIAVAVAIFIILQASFRNWWLASLIFLSLPAAVIGGVLAIYVGGGVVSLGSLVGLVTVLGIAARNGILLIQHYRHLEQVEGEPFSLELVLRGAGERLSPILMTALSTGFALLPLVIAGNIPGHEVELPMAIVILGGLITATLMTLFVVPLLYLWFGSKTVEATVTRPTLEATS